MKVRERNFSLLQKAYDLPNGGKKMMHSCFEGRMLIEPHVGNHLAAGVGVQAVDDVLTLHGELETEGGTGEVDEKRLVADIELVGVTGDGGSHHLGP